MNGRHRRGYIALVFATATLIAASIFLYRIRPLEGITFGSTAIVWLCSRTLAYSRPSSARSLRGVSD